MAELILDLPRDAYDETFHCEIFNKFKKYFKPKKNREIFTTLDTP